MNDPAQTQRLFQEETKGVPSAPSSDQSGITAASEFLVARDMLMLRVESDRDWQRAEHAHKVEIEKLRTQQLETERAYQKELKAMEMSAQTANAEAAKKAMETAWDRHSVVARQEMEAQLERKRLEIAERHTLPLAEHVTMRWMVTTALAALVLIMWIGSAYGTLQEWVIPTAGAGALGSAIIAIVRAVLSPGRKK